MTGAGRPLRFLGLVLGGWIAMRVLWLWSTGTPLPEAIRQSVPEVLRPIETSRAPATVPAVIPPPSRIVPAVALAHRPAGPKAPFATGEPPPESKRFLLALLARSEFGSVIDMTPPDERVAAPVGPPSIPQPLRGPARWSGGAWMIARRGGGVGADAPQLGGSQAGVRIDYRIGRDVALTSRLAAPLRGIGSEASLGIAWTPERVPLRFVAEQRVALDGGKGGPALGVSGGGTIALPEKFDLSAYAQGGAVWRARTEPYADGAVRAARPVAQDGRLRLDLGVGAWGAAQRGVSRIDLGPSIGVVLPLASVPTRVTVDWRERVAGNARPGSGPALSIGADF